MTPKRVVVVGGGITGLTAAYSLAQARRRSTPVEEYLVEAQPRLGGVMRTERVEGCLVEAGPDSYLTEKRDATELCRELGLGGELIGSNDAQRRTLILHNGRLVPLPDGFEFLVPTRVWSALRTPLLSVQDKLALATEVFQQPPSVLPDESVASFVERHFGRGVLENIVEPLLGAVYGGDAGQLSAPAVLPRLVETERKWGSLIRGLRAAARARQNESGAASGRPNARPPLFTTLRSGFERLVTALQEQLDSRRVLCGQRVAALKRATAGGFTVQFDDGRTLDAEAVLLALPAYASARLVEDFDRVLATRLQEIPYSSSLIAVAGYARAALGPLPAAFGFLVPRQEKPRLRACTFLATKFPHRVPPGQEVLRCFYGGVNDEAVLELGDREIEQMVERELGDILGLRAKPSFFKTYRWPKAVAQYTVGHAERLAAIRARQQAHRGLFLCGNAFEGIGIPDCVRSGKTAAEQCLAQFGFV